MMPIDSMIESSPVCKRAVLETVSALRKQGHECIEFTSPLSTPSILSSFSVLTFYQDASAMEVFLGLASSDGYKKMLSHLDSDPMVSLNQGYTIYSSHNPTGRRTVCSWSPWAPDYRPSFVTWHAGSLRRSWATPSSHVSSRWRERNLSRNLRI